MAGPEDASDLFSVPDFWRPSAWLDQKFNGNDITTTEKPFFALEVHVPDTKCLEASQGLIDIGTVQPLTRAGDDNHVFFKLPSLLQELADQHAAQLPSKPSIEQPEPESEPLTSDDDDDFWLFSSGDSIDPPQLRTWETFEQPDQEQGSALFISEAGPAAFDALLATRHAAADTPAAVLDAAVYCACLLNLALGRSSVLFSWEADKNSFVKTAPHLGISGFSLDSITAVDRLCLDCGNAARHLQAFAETTYSAASTPTRVALAGAVDRLVTTVRSGLSEHGRHARSVLQLQSVVQPAHAVLSYFKRLVKKLAQQGSDEALLSCLFEEAQASEYRSELLKEATRELLRILSKPWTDFVEEWVGLKAEGGTSLTKAGPGRGFVKVADKMWIDDQGFELEEPDYFLDESKVPAFIPEDMVQTIFETGRNLRFLREHHPEHPLSRPDVVLSAMPPKLEWEFDWNAVSELERKVAQYRDAVSRAIQGILPETQLAIPFPGANKRKFDVMELDYFGKDEAQVEANILASIRDLDQPLQSNEPQDSLTCLLHNHLYHQADPSLTSSTLSPHWTLVPLLSFNPLISAQSTLINQECTTLLFTAHHLRAHIDLLRQYFLLGNGLLCSRLSHALFDPNLSTAERRAGVALGTGGGEGGGGGGGGGGTMGLRLGGRQTWPPASSELRLALMGVLAECYESSSSLPRGRNSNSNNLPGDLSFAVRALSAEEIDRCMDPDGLEALDFLRLSYKPPAALRSVLSPGVLVKYDRVFRLLLRVLRMLFVANELFYSAGGGGSGNESESNASRRLRIEARHFIHKIASYFFDVAIAAPWKRFERWLDAVETEATCTNTSESHLKTKSKKEACSPDVLRDRQEQVLDEILGGLLLRKRQAPVMGLLEEVFGVVLVFAKGLRTGGRRQGQGQTQSRSREEGEKSPEELYKLFRKKVEVFVTVCRGLGEKMAASGGGGGGGGGGQQQQVGQGREKGEGVEQLLVRLDLEGFYTRGFV